MTAGGLRSSVEAAPRLPFQNARSRSSAASVELVTSSAAPFLSLRPATELSTVDAVLSVAPRMNPRAAAAQTPLQAGEAEPPIYQPTASSLEADGSCSWPAFQSVFSRPVDDAREGDSTTYWLGFLSGDVAPVPACELWYP